MKPMLLLSMLLALLVSPVTAAESKGATAGERAYKTTATPSNEELEKSLQGLSWPQFKSVVTAVPALKSQVDAFGNFGWQYVQANYKTYSWRKSVSKLEPGEKIELARLIEKARKGSIPQ